jgi:hypothetical protein
MKITKRKNESMTDQGVNFKHHLERTLKRIKPCYVAPLKCHNLLPFLQQQLKFNVSKLTLCIAVASIFTNSLSH